MKNVYLIPTDKPTGIFSSNSGLQFSIRDKVRTVQFVGYHIYITSDEEINQQTEPCWCINTIKNTWDADLIYYQGSMPQYHYVGFKKIILTTDQNLIKDGVQSIDDEFLEWFVKNPSCEWVEVKNISIKVVKGYNNNGEIDCYYTNGYEIIIPQEEPKQETLEEAAIKYATEANGVIVNQRKKQQFTAGAKWQAERMYTYDEMRTIAYNAYCLGQLDSPTEGKFNEWIQKFKKK
jgi:hypothetical protein